MSRIVRMHSDLDLLGKEESEVRNESVVRKLFIE